jgi:hypothetical protein
MGKSRWHCNRYSTRDPLSPNEIPQSMLRRNRSANRARQVLQTSDDDVLTSPHAHAKIRKGDVETALREADAVVTLNTLIEDGRFPLLAGAAHQSPEGILIDLAQELGQQTSR